MAYGFHVYFRPEAPRTTVRVKRIRHSDCVAALQEGFEDFVAMPTYPAFVGIFYAFADSRSFRCLRSATRCTSSSRSLRVSRSSGRSSPSASTR